ncbi:endolytic transglycosylase MltG [Tropicimonas sp. IMCC34043]|uniref:endolytic transglycosylase MltG n=1 Tax=Tropicimonas sp. IMCC34043 TaxID=2248760 RepID=UPI000E22305E|nr:endolytic transglycosylase MltG [Tropicimonas sp. IMCC34043]
MARSIASNALTIFVVLLLGVASAVIWGNREYSGSGPLAEAICVQVPTGASLGSVSQALKAQGAISSPTIFRLGAEYSKRSDLLKAGSFVVPAHASMEEIILAITASGRSTCGTEVNYRIGVAMADMIVRDLDPATQKYEEVADIDIGVDPVPAEVLDILAEPSTRIRVTLAEGVTSWQVVEALKAAPFLSGELATVPAEGALAPDSYEVGRNADRAALVAQMETRQADILGDLWAARAPGLPYETPDEALTMASIVEKETGVAEERPLVASVFVNRLEQGMRLQTDPTVIYGVTGGKGVLGRGLRQSELAKATPYNTYVNRGLPPTPIANPGRASIAAALNPAESDYLFFVADGSGGHAFAATLVEHNANVNRWRAIEAQRANQ